MPLVISVKEEKLLTLLVKKEKSFEIVPKFKFKAAFTPELATNDCRLLSAILVERLKTTATRIANCSCSPILRAVANLGRQYELQCQIERRLESATNPATPPTYRLQVVDRYLTFIHLYVILQETSKPHKHLAQREISHFLKL
ncbi:hypothetical protein J6590_019630 [Homalodisca vitripennis]|nr:hypothetical protein J6590_019630 [Homalodisca vitripennis]